MKGLPVDAEHSPAPQGKNILLLCGLGVLLIPACFISRLMVHVPKKTVEL